MKTILKITGTILLASSTASANPVMMVQEFRGQAVAGPHVKLSYTYNIYSPPTGATTHGTSHSNWVRTGSTSRDTGSGVKSIPILEMCDCHVPSGTTLDYQLVFSTGTSTAAPLRVTVPSAPSTTVACVAECQAADTLDAGIVDAPISVDLPPDIASPVPDSALPPDSAPVVDGAIPLDVPLATDVEIAPDTPIATGGITRVDARVATGGTPAITADAAIPSGGIPATGGTTTISGSTKASGGGCGLRSPGTPPSLPMLALLGFALLGIRRRP